MNNRMQTYRIISYKNGIQLQIAVVDIDLFEKLEICDFIFLSFKLKRPYFKSSKSRVSQNEHASLKTIVLMFSLIFLNSKFKFSRKCQNKSVCVRRFFRCMNGYTYKILRYI